MLRRKCFVGLAVLVAVGLLSVQAALGADGRGQTPAASGERWDDDGPLSGPLGQLALLQGDDGGPRGGPGFGPPGPPPGRDDDRPGPPPPRRERGPEGDRRQPARPPRDGDRPPPRDEGRPGRDGGMPGGPMMFQLGPGRGPGTPGDPEMRELLQKDHQLDRDTHDLAMHYPQATGQEREKIEKDVEEAVNKQFDVRQQRRNLELKRLEEELKRVREAVDRREKARKELVQKRVSELLRLDNEPEF